MPCRTAAWPMTSIWKRGKATWNAKAVGTYRHHVQYKQKHYMKWQNENKMLNVKVLQSISNCISGQVDRLNKTFKLSYTSIVFCCGWCGRLFQIFTIRFQKKYFLTSIRLWCTNNLLRCPSVVSFELMRKNLGQSRSTNDAIHPWSDATSVSRPICLCQLMGS